MDKTSFGEETANLSDFVLLFDLRCFCLFPLSLGFWEGLRLVILALPGLFFYLCFMPIVAICIVTKPLIIIVLNTALSVMLMGFHRSKRP